ncbi:MAG TPA: cyclic nucleotide-binding domain-containing protein [Pyrinomonadaceae bacterium]|nr:cyclic nucleotide-binding domain-containing protein [Pyrinomonadaceae bacterium]
MPREITDKNRIIDAVRNLQITAELFEEQNGKPKYAGDLEVVVHGRDYGNGKKVGPYVRLLEYEPREEVMRQGEWGGNTFYIAVNGVLDVFVRGTGGGQQRISQLQPGALFGEMAVLAGVERNATVVVPENNQAVVLEVTRPALRLLRKLPTFGQVLDDTYRKHGFGRVLADPLISDTLSKETIEDLRRIGQFMIYGKHHVLCVEKKPIEKVLFIKSGWVRRSRGIPFDPAATGIVMGVGIGEGIGVDFLGAGNCLGLEGASGAKTWGYNATLMARSEILEIPVSALSTQPDLRDRVVAAFAKFSTADDKLPPTIEELPDLRSMRAAEEEIATGIVDGTNLLVMDMNLCVRCGNCSLACHKVHGQSRLLRRGISISRPTTIGSTRTQSVLIPQVCMHCKDPECLTGCPTGAIFRDPIGQVDIDPKTCIGCFDCATQCPYDAISMVPRVEPPLPAAGVLVKLKQMFSLKLPDLVPAPVSDDVVAIKCNLCEQTPLNPSGARRKAYSCEENCPTGALVRVDPIEYFSEAGRTQGIVFRDQTHAIGRNIHKSDPLARTWHIVGLLLVAAASTAAIWGLRKYGFDTKIRGSWLTMRWLTGLTGLFGIAAVMTYPFRKQVYRRRAGALRYWMLAHAYVGLVAGVILMLHSGPRTGSWLTTLLFLAFEVVVFSGLYGVAAYILAPRIMTSIEGEPLLLEDLIERRRELQEELIARVAKAEGWLRDELEKNVVKRFQTFGFLMRQLIKREALKTLLAEARQEFKDRIVRTATSEERELLLATVQTAVTLRRVEALILLHQLLKQWVPLHVVSTALMLALMVVHIIHAIFFTIK